MATRRAVLGLALTAPALLVGCSDVQSAAYHLRQTLSVRMPDGSRAATSVLKLTVKYHPAGLPLTNTYLTTRPRGQAPYAFLSEARVLAALLPSSDLPVRMFARHFGHKHLNPRAAAALFEALPDLVGGPPVSVPSNLWPRMVLFEDVLDPLSAKPVIGDTPQTRLGAGVHLEDFQIALIPPEPLTTGIETDMPWLRDVGKQPIGGPIGENKRPKTKGAAWADRLYRSQFIRGDSAD